MYIDINKVESMTLIATTVQYGDLSKIKNTPGFPFWDREAETLK